MIYPNEPGFVAESDTSESAASRMTKAVVLREQVRARVEAAGWSGATCDELEVALSMKHQTCSARCTELKLEHHIFPNGKKRMTRGGHRAAVYVVENYLPVVRSLHE